MPTELLTRTAGTRSTPPGAVLRTSGAAPPPPPSGEDDGGRRPEGLPVVLAIAIAVAIGVLFTYLGMLTQIWANMSGAQLPGA